MSKLETLASQAGLRIQHVAYDSADLYKGNVRWSRVALISISLGLLIWSLQ